jgi:hypothetical protein
MCGVGMPRIRYVHIPCTMKELRSHAATIPR